jgi:hypothetical protein
VIPYPLVLVDLTTCRTIEAHTSRLSDKVKWPNITMTTEPPCQGSGRLSHMRSSSRYSFLLASATPQLYPLLGMQNPRFAGLSITDVVEFALTLSQPSSRS